MKDKLKRFLLHGSFPRFVLVGAGNTALSLLLMFLFEGLGYWPSTAIAYVGGGALSFFLNRSFTFRSEERFGRSLAKFVLNVAVCYGVGYGIAKPLVSWLLRNSAISGLWQERFSKLAGMALYTLLNYFGQKRFAFRKSGPKPEPGGGAEE